MLSRIVRTQNQVPLGARAFSQFVHLHPNAEHFDINKRNISGTPALLKYGITHPFVYRNCSVAELYEAACDPITNYTHDPKAFRVTIAENGALVASSSTTTGRSPKERRIVKDDKTANEVHWGEVNIPMSAQGFSINRQRALDYLNVAPRRLFVVDGFVGADPKWRIKARCIMELPYHALFMRNMLVRPTTKEELAEFDQGPDWHVLNAGMFKADPINTDSVKKTVSVAANFTTQEYVVLGSLYAGEMKKGLFGVMNTVMPWKGQFPMHASANEDKNGNVSVFFGLSGTGKTTLSADPKRLLIGDDEHVWTDNGIFNMEGGCYAKACFLSREKEPDIYDAIKFGTVLENIRYFDNNSRVVNYDDISLTENTRAAYPLEHIQNSKMPSIGGHPKHIIFLTCDAYGVLPPVSKLTPEQTMYHFITGYTAKVAGTEIGIKEPQPSFSSCFGEAFIPLHPYRYAKLLEGKMKKYGTKVWLVNSGWAGGSYPEGSRMSLKITRAIIDAIHSGELEKAPTQNMPVFNFQVPKTCTGVDANILMPANAWKDKEKYNKTVKILAEKFIKNFARFQEQSGPEVVRAGPQL